ncbi:hypothetical protein EYW49_21955 [Siculibacillus lacustris]|uniref:Uncharacterized protein n=1 Tax=Siculibacillus lacustris TaxID=1549641 RepID=A0A4Q9VEI9_9HYPH|nr:hypothetical protein [Siculibacillus lacustris]TBW32605.1 hypothetical protein EYW49_21955 [Siculibacillus lacustris]
MTAADTEHAERIAILETKVDALTASVDKLSTQVETLVALFQQAKGARWVLMVAAGLGGYLAGKGAMLSAWVGTVAR